ncbi:MAG: enoyl-CoA hydratase/isomerase family protein [Steroidobacteraceae bacterium]
MSDEEILQVRYDGNIAIMTMNNPKRLNAFNMKMRQAMYARLLEIVENEECRAIVLTGAGGNLCAGGDISEMKRRKIIEARIRFDLPTRIFKLLVTGPKPFIVAVEGNCMGAGVSFVAASDYAVAASDAKFGCAWIKVGLMPDVGGIWSIPRKIGHRKAMELCALANTFEADEALRLQLVNKLCEPGRALEEAIEVARRFAKNPPVAMALMKAALNIGNDTIDQAVNCEVNYQSVLMSTADFSEAAQAFMEKRKPNFTGN